MEVFLGDELIEDLANSNIEEILTDIYSRLDNAIIEKIYLNDAEINKNFLLTGNLNLDKVDTLHFKIKQVNNLIDETLEEIDSYLPKLKNGIVDTANLFRKDKLQAAQSKYELCLKGIEWYVNVSQRILSLLNYKDLEEEIEKLLTDFNKKLTNAIKKFQNQDFIFLAKILEYEVTYYIDQFIKLNNKIITVRT